MAEGAPAPTERRRHRRRSVRFLVDYVSREGLRCEYANTLGAGGMFVESDHPLAEGLPLRLRFRIPGGERLHEVEGRVVWSNRSEPLEASVRPPGMGIQFTDPVAAAGVARELEDMPDWLDPI